MPRFTVWAPKASRVDLCLRDRRHPMAPLPTGWWELTLDVADPPLDYAFSLDGGDPRPDPRSFWQPEGVHGPSRHYDHGDFEWTDARWRAQPLGSAVVYELHVGTFTPEGTFDGAIDRLDHLADLGVTHVELMPVVEFPGDRGWGYDGADLFAPHHAYGGPDGLKRLVNACHEKGLAVLLDVVYNHFGPSGAYAGAFGPYHTARHTSPWGDAINFDGPGSDEVRRFFIDNALMWMRDYRIDGLRLDAVHAMLDTSARHILEELAEEVWALEAHVGRPLVLIAESDLNDPRIVRSREAGGYGLDAQWLDDFRHSLHTVLTGENQGFHGDFGSIADLAHALAHAYVYCGRYSSYRNRCHGRPPTGLPGERFVGFLQNHDQVGNRAQGERSTHLLSPGLLRVGAAFVLTAPFVPMLFQGEEWGASTPFLYFTDHREEDLAKAVSEGRRSEFAAFGWNWDEVPDPQDPQTFLRSKLDWSELDDPAKADLLDWHRRLIRLRRDWPELTDSRLDRVHVRFSEEERWLTFRRGRVVGAANFADREQALPLDYPDCEVRLVSDARVRAEEGRLRMPPESIAFLTPVHALSLPSLRGAERAQAAVATQQPEV